MGKRGQININLDEIIIEEENKQRKDEFDSILQKIKKMSEAIELHENVKDAVSNKEVDNNYLSYVENSLEDKLFNDARFDKIKSKILLEVICPELTNIENFDIEKLQIDTIGNHFEENENYIDKICTYDNKFMCLFGINEKDQEKFIKYEKRKFSRADMIDAISRKLNKGQKVQMDQYDEYYVITEDIGIKVYSERKMVSLVKVEETIFDKLKNKLLSIFNANIFSKKKFTPNIELIYESNPNRINDFKFNSKSEAKRRMKTLLNTERKTIKEGSV